jgi:hypothetical protein
VKTHKQQNDKKISHFSHPPANGQHPEAIEEKFSVCICRKKKKKKKPS